MQHSQHTHQEKEIKCDPERGEVRRSKVCIEPTPASLLMAGGPVGS